MLPKCEPYTDHHLGSAKDPHTLRILDEPHPDPTGASGADHPQPRMPLRSQELDQSISNREYREGLDESPFPHSALLLQLLCYIGNLPAPFYKQYSWQLSVVDRDR
jgi:hypothetical protein